MKQESLLAEIMNYIVSGYVYFVAFALVLYMISSLVTGVSALVMGLMDISESIQEILQAPERLVLELALLHTIVFTIVLGKAYRILITFAQTRQINIKYVIELAIIASIIELVFNVKNYTLEMSMLLAGFAFVNLVIYLFFYKTLRGIQNDNYKDLEATK